MLNYESSSKKAQMNKSRFTFQATPSPSQDDGLLRFTGVAYSGGLVPAYKCYGDIAIDLTNTTIANSGKVTVLYGHNHDLPVGSARLIHTGNQVLLESCTISAETKEGERIAQCVKAGTDWMFSVGARNGKWRALDKSDATQANGQTLNLDGLITGDLEIYELSIVPFGADHEAKAKALFNFSMKDNNMATDKEIAEIEARLSLKFKADNERLAAENEAMKADLHAVSMKLAADKKARGEALAIEFGKTAAEGVMFESMTAEQVAFMREIKPATTKPAVEFNFAKPDGKPEVSAAEKANPQLGAFMDMAKSSITQFKAMTGVKL